MIHGYHVIFGAYGFWLPNDPRGSWSDFVGAWELVRFGRATKSIERLELTPQQECERQRARSALKYPPVFFSGIQARAIGRGFANAVKKSEFTIWACSVLPEHVHLVIARHTYKVEHMMGLLKGEATKQLKKEEVHPLAEYLDADGNLPTPWASRGWKVYLDDEEAIENAIRYVEENPAKENKPRQTWNFVTPFAGLEKGWVTYH
jgi:REP element-mobilizing transposase RayT